MFSSSQKTIAGNLVNRDPKELITRKRSFSDRYIINWLQSTKAKLYNLLVHSLVNLEKTGFATKG